MSCLEAQGISCAYMALPDDFIVFVDLALSAKSAKNHFYNLNTVYVDEDADTVYLPLSMANFEGGFTTCRQKGAAAYSMSKACVTQMTTTNASLLFLMKHGLFISLLYLMFLQTAFQSL